MFEIIKPDTKINFVKLFPVAVSISALLVIGSLALAIGKMNFGVDFRGGAEVLVKFDSEVSLETVRSALAKQNQPNAVVQTIGEITDYEVLIKLQGEESELNSITEVVGAAITKDFSAQHAEIVKVDIVGPKAGAQLRLSGFQAMLWAVLAIMIYLALRFDMKYAPGAIVAIFHDVIIVLGVYGLTGTEFTLSTVAAVLAVIGYSVNDTVIIYDRIREHEEKSPGLSLSEHINRALNETLSRSVLTSGTTLSVSLAMFFLGGSALRDFFLAINVGIIVGTFSSSFVASPITLLMEKMRKGTPSSALNQKANA